MRGKKKFSKICGIVSLVLLALVVVFVVLTLAVDGPDDEVSDIKNVMAIVAAALFVLMFVFGSIFAFGGDSQQIQPKNERIPPEMDEYSKKLLRVDDPYESEKKEFRNQECDGFDVKYINDEFVFKGKFDLGELGVFESNKHNININIGEGLEEFNEEHNSQMTAEEATKSIKELIGKFQEKIKTNSHKLLNYFLAQMLLNTRVSDSYFWEAYKSKGYVSSDECYNQFHNFMDEKLDIEELNGLYNEKGITAEKVDIEKIIRENFKFFDLDKLLDSLHLEVLDFDTTFNHFSLQLSDETDDIFCGAYEEFDEDLLPQDWHNF